MKRILSITIATLLYFGVNAQSGKVYEAFNHFTQYLNTNGQEKDELIQALDNITAASVHESTKDDPKTWFYKGKVQQLIYQDSILRDQQANAIIGAADAFMQAIKLSEIPDAKKFRQLDETVEMLGYAAGQLHNYGLTLYKAGDAANAYLSFTKAIEVYEFMKARGHVDMVRLNTDDSRFLAATLAVGLEKFDESKAGFATLIENKYDNVFIYKTLSSIYLMEKDYDNALAILNKGAAAYPDDASVTIDMINIYLTTDRATEAIDIMQTAIKQEPTNAQLYFVLATTYGNLKQDDLMLATYKKAIEIDPTYADAYNNLGAYYFNKSNEIYKEMEELPLSAQTKYKELDAQRLDLLKQALPYLEKANELKPDNLEIMDALRVLYHKLGEYDKSKALKERIQQLQSGQ